MTQTSAGHRAAERLMYDKEAIARAVTKRLYDEYPELIERHGERGRQKTLQDMHYNIEHLIPAVELEDPPMFVKYVEWLDSMLRSRGVLTKYTKRCLELVAEESRERFDADEVKAIDAVLGAGLAVVEGGA